MSAIVSSVSRLAWRSCRSMSRRPGIRVACWLGLLAVCGCTAEHYRHSADNVAYGLIAQKSPLVTNMEPRFTIEKTNALDLEVLPLASQTNDFLGEAASTESGARVLTLDKALDMGVNHSRLYQSSKEQLYLVGLSLSL